MTEYPLVKIEEDAQLLVTTNVNSPISLQGVCQCSISDSSGKRKAYLVMYDKHKVKKKAEISKELYLAIKFVFETINDIENPETIIENPF